EIMDEMATLVPLYRQSRYQEMTSGSQQPLDGLGPKMAVLQAVPRQVGAADGEGFLLTTGRSLYTSYDGAALHTPEADKLHREEFVEVNPADAAALGIADGDEVVLSNRRGEIAMRCRLTDAVQPHMLFVPLYFEGGAVSLLFGQEEEAVTSVELAVRSRA
ncbi:MAG: molybdopterin dinucleotide binding domain-containing protein, partial [Dehalococcoidia bacterium]